MESDLLPACGWLKAAILSGPDVRFSPGSEMWGGQETKEKDR